MRRLERRTNGAYDTVLLIHGDTVIGAWPATTEALRDFRVDNNPELWEPNWPSDTAPEAYGDLVVQPTEYVEAK